MFDADNGDIVINFPTKEHYNNPSKMEYITEGIVDLVRVIEERKIKSVAIPALGCGEGGLDWGEVKFEIINVFKDVNTSALLYEPQE